MATWQGPNGYKVGNLGGAEFFKMGTMNHNGTPMDVTAIVSLTFNGNCSILMWQGEWDRCDTEYTPERRGRGLKRYRRTAKDGESKASVMLWGLNKANRWLNLPPLNKTEVEEYNALWEK